jgi:hypothetical protein
MKLGYEFDQKVAVLGPVDATTTAKLTSYINIGKIGTGHLEFDILFGNLTSSDSSGDITVTVEANDVNDTSSSDNNEGAIAFSYQLSAAVGTDSMGAVTAATSSGVVLGFSDDNKVLCVYVDPAVASKKYVRAVITPSADATATLVGAMARFIPRKAQASVNTSS